MIKRTIINIFIISFLGAGIQGCVFFDTRNSLNTPTGPLVITTTSDVISPIPDDKGAAIFSEQLGCWPVIPLEQGNDIRGSIIFSSIGDEHLFAWDVNSFSIRKLDYDSLAFSISLDNSLVASLIPEKNEFALISADQTTTYSLDQGHGYTNPKFLEDDLIYIGVPRDEFVSNYTPAEFVDVYYLLDPFTGELTFHKILLPNFSPGPGVYRYPIEYSPDLEYVVYKTTRSTDGSNQFALMNTQTNNLVWTGNSMPQWKTDGNTLSYISDNLFSLSKDGISSQITWFDGKILSGLGPLHKEIPWSPNGRYVAFQENYSSINLLYIWDNQEKVVFRPCLPDELRAYSDYYVYWSFDSQFLLLRLVYPDFSAKQSETLPLASYSDFLLDMTNQVIFELPPESERGDYGTIAIEGAIARGWVIWEIP